MAFVAAHCTLLLLPFDSPALLFPHLLALAWESALAFCLLPSSCFCLLRKVDFASIHNSVTGIDILNFLPLYCLKAEQGFSVLLVVIIKNLTRTPNF